MHKISTKTEVVKNLPSLANYFSKEAQAKIRISFHSLGVFSNVFRVSVSNSWCNRRKPIEEYYEKRTFWWRIFWELRYTRTHVFKGCHEILIVLTVVDRWGWKANQWRSNRGRWHRVLDWHRVHVNWGRADRFMRLLKQQILHQLLLKIVLQILQFL